MSKARITYRFDSKEPADSTRKASRVPVSEEKVIPLYQEEFKVVANEIRDNRDTEEITPYHQAEREQVESMFEPHALNTFTTDFGSWSSQIETEGERVERIIRESQSVREEQGVRDVPAERTEPITERNRDEWSSWTQKGPYIEPETGARYAKSSGAPWIRIATSVAGAVVTGIAFGFFVLSLFSSSDRDATQSASGQTIAVPSANVQAAGPSKAPGGATKTGTDQASALPAAAAAVTPVQIPAKSYTFLQNGVFSSLQGAQAIQDTLKKKGLASALDTSDKLTVFVGFAKSKDDANTLRQQVQTADKTIEVYIKSLDIPAATGIRWGGQEPEAVPSFITEGDKLVNTINELALIHLAETKPTALSDSSLQTIHSSHQALTTLSTSLNEGLNDDSKPIVQKMTSALNSAVQSMDEYKKSPSTAMLWQAQTSMMQYILAQKELLKKISVS
ncbi:SPOR domain-containing protein [Paenibacillus aceris]|uniref:Stage II sporulation protein B n=1 Tax=Paenibacillus aceris TaxID=869555 RepID=A0ABS4I572_9BACL|nr:SPOR domain-containing protein [Paenibacillus aceris]MBP1966059.1 stage II sporulation protein B [Paenibacillus aceris]NHW39714.1 SPOR domain-containing protein [Paenibacillus aceris]